MKICKKCGKNFKPVKGLVNFCSIECRNSRTWTEEDKIKKSNSAKISKKVAEANKNRPITFSEKNPEFWKLLKEKRLAKRKERILLKPYGELKFELLRERITYEQDSKCNKCGLSHWLGEKIILELEHKDGNHFNNERDNLEMLCPNCHSTTKTWRGRNKKNMNVGKVSDEKLLETLIINDWNIRKSLLQLELAGKGGNYKRCYRLKADYDSLNI